MRCRPSQRDRESQRFVRHDGVDIKEEITYINIVRKINQALFETARVFPHLYPCEKFIVSGSIPQRILLQSISILTRRSPNSSLEAIVPTTQGVPILTRSESIKGSSTDSVDRDYKETAALTQFKPSNGQPLCALFPSFRIARLTESVSKQS